jgi:hypothetical protein
MPDANRIDLTNRGYELSAMLDLLSCVDLSALDDQHEALYGVELLLKLVAGEARSFAVAVETQGGGRHA